MVQPVILIRIGYGYVVVRIGGEVICILIFGLALFFPVFAAHLQDDKCWLSFSRFLHLRLQGASRLNRSRNQSRNQSRNFTQDDAEAAAAEEGLVLVTSTKSSTGYKGVVLKEGRYQAMGKRGNENVPQNIGSYATSYEAALNYSRYIGPAKAVIEAAAEAAAALSANFTQDDAEAAAAEEGLVLVTSTRSSTGYKNVSLNNGKYRARSQRGNEKPQNIGNYTTSHEAAFYYSKHIGAQQAAAEKAAEEARDGKRKSSMASITSAVIQKIMTRAGPRANKVAVHE